MTDERDADAPAEATGAAPTASHDALVAREVPVDVTGDAADDANRPQTVDVFARRRTELGLTLEDVANQLKFSARQIEALETGNFDRLPGATFVRGMMRSYARLLKLEPAQIVDQLSAAGAKPQHALEGAVSLRAPIPFSEGGRHVNLVYTLVSIVVLAAVAFFALQWYLESGSPRKLAFVRPVSIVSLRAEVPVPHLDAARSGPAVATFASANESPLAETTPVGEENSAVPPAPAAARIAASGKRRITLRFDSQSWVEIKGAEGAVLMSQLNQAGIEKIVEGDPPFELTIGNARRVRLFYDDKPVDLKPFFHADVARLTLN